MLDKQSKITSKEIYDSYPDKNSYEWKSKGVHIYKALKKKEDDRKSKNNKR